jgi:glycosyltransferase involved in cell wall biosynthesis
MRILMLCSSYPLHDRDSSSIFLRNLAIALSRGGIDVHILAPDHRLADESIRDPKVRVSRFRYLPRRWQTLAYGAGILPNLRQHPWRWLQVPFFALAMGWSLLGHCRRQRPDVIHAHWIIPQGLVAAAVGRLLNIPVVITAHGGDAFALRGRVVGALKRYALRHSQAWTANTRTTAAAAAASANLPGATIIPMGVDVDYFCGGQHGRAQACRDENHRRIVLFVGRLVEKKGVADLLEAFSRLPSPRREQTILWIIGDGTERERLERLAQTLDIDSSVKFWGHVQNQALPAYYAAADIFIAPSIVDASGDTEGQGVVIIEAMASGVAVVACRAGGIPDVIAHEKTGLLVQSQHPQGLSAAIDRLLGDAQLRARLGRAGQAHARQNFAWDAVATQFMALYRSLANR